MWSGVIQSHAHYRITVRLVENKHPVGGYFDLKGPTATTVQKTMLNQNLKTIKLLELPGAAVNAAGDGIT